MNKKTKIFLALLIVVVVIGAAYFFVTQKKNTPVPSQTTDQTSNWKTYTNTTYNYSIRLPSAYPDNSETNIDQSSGELDLKMVTKSVWVAVWKNSGNLTTDEWLKESGNMVGKNTYPAQKTTFNGYDALVSNRGQSTNWYFISHGNYIYEVEDNETIGAAPTFKPTQQQIQDQKEILSTFKFLDSSNNTTGYTDNYNKAVKILQAIPEIQIIENTVIKNGRNTSFSSAGGENGDVVTVLLFEGGFPDKYTTRIATFMVNVKTNEIQVYDATSVPNKNFSLEEWKKTVKDRFQ